MRTRYLCALTFVVLSGCSGQFKGGAEDGNVLDRKTAAANDLADGTADGDPCEANRWYGDGTCDSFCPGSDTDCIPDGGAVVCAMLSEESDGKCGRGADDPCLFQDPDCNATSPDEPVGPDPDEPVGCARILEKSDGECTRPDSDPCSSQDPDCSVDCVAMEEMPDGVCEDRPDTRCGQDPDCSVACPAIYIAPDGVCPNDPCDPDCNVPKPLYNCDTSGAMCDMLSPTCPEGQTPSVSNSCYGPCVPVDQCLPVCGGGAGGAGGGAAAPAAPFIAPPSDGICAPDPCGGWDPDCDVACEAYVERPDGVCSRPADDACSFQDPDCVTDPGGTICATYVEPSDGVCSRPDSDPCIFQDPDCTGGGFACAEYIEVPDGVCSRSSDDPCIFQDPDCGMSGGVPGAR